MKALMELICSTVLTTIFGIAWSFLKAIDIILDILFMDLGFIKVWIQKGVNNENI